MEPMGGRVSLSPRPVRARGPALEAGLLGHCPGEVRLGRLRADARELMRAAGFGEAVDALEGRRRPPLSGEAAVRVRDLYHLPIPLLSSAELDDIFPAARRTAAGYASRLAGQGAWLPQAVDDFFANGGERLWMVRVPEPERQDGFLARALSRVTGDPVPGPLPLHEAMDLRGLATLLVIPELAVVGAPDLERLQVAATLSDPAPLAIAPPPPRFLPLPCPQPRSAAVIPTPDPKLPGPVETLPLLNALIAALDRYRPDVQLLFTLPLIARSALGGPAVDGAVLDALAALGGTAAGAALRRVQLLFPYLRGPRARLQTPVGVIAGIQAAVAGREGHWRSVAGRPLVTEGRPYPALRRDQVQGLRETPGVGVLVARGERVELDDERLAVPALHPGDYQGTADPTRLDGYRSAEVGRFMGYLIRQLRALGERLVFDLDPADPRPGLALDAFFRRLFAAGALRGALPEEGYRVSRVKGGAGLLAYDIEVAPAFPIDRMRLTFINRDGEWQTGVSGA